MIPNNITNNNLVEIFTSSGEKKGWIQPPINQSYIPVLNVTIINDIYAATPDDKIVVLTESSDPWFWTQGWQQLEEEADKDIAEGRFTSHKNMEDFIADLDN
jgi:hypothetical protein